MQKSKSKLQKLSQQSLIKSPQVYSQYTSNILMNFHKRHAWQPLDESTTRVKLNACPSPKLSVVRCRRESGPGETAALPPPFCFGRIIKGRPVVISQPLTAFVPVCNTIKKKKNTQPGMWQSLFLSSPYGSGWWVSHITRGYMEHSQTYELNNRGEKNTKKQQKNKDKPPHNASQEKKSEVLLYIQFFFSAFFVSFKGLLSWWDV